MSIAERYYADLAAGLSEGPPRELGLVIDRLAEAARRGHRVYTMGNGASAALAAHMACDLGKGTARDLGAESARSEGRLRIYSLPDNTALLTAYGNDVDYSSVFVEQLKSLVEAGDVVIGISGSGSSPNVVAAMRFAKRVGAYTVAMTGRMASAEKIAEHSDIVVRAPSAIMEQIEDYHVAFNHIIAFGLKERLFRVAGK